MSNSRKERQFVLPNTTMYEMKYPHLFSPIQLGDKVIRNRIFGAPAQALMLDANNYPEREVADWYEEKARGGVGVVTISEFTVDAKHGHGNARNTRIEDERVLASISRISDAINKHGAVASLELNHHGMVSKESRAAGFEIYAPSEQYIAGGGKVGEAMRGILIKEMPEEIILETIEKFANAAAFAKQAGFGMVLIHAGHGWLLHQWMSPLTNKRKDKWGGENIENRMRLPIAICDRIKEKCGKNFPIEFRFSSTEAYTGGYTLADGVEIAKGIDGHCDLIHVSQGSHEVYEAFILTHPNMFLSEAPFLSNAVEIKKHVKTPVAAVGAYGDPAQMEEILAAGKVDVIEVARAILADPEMPNKARMGKEDSIRKCLRCFTCFSHQMPYDSDQRSVCAINPVIGREGENRYLLPPARKEKVLVVGGGVGGMQAALTAAERGHQVILCEKSDRLGGVLRCEESVSFKFRMTDYLNYQARQVMNNPAIEVRLNTEVTAELARQIEPDAIIAALGARPVIPTFIKGYDGNNVVSAEEVYNDITKAGQKVVILGGGLVGTELGIHLARNGRNVTVVEMLPKINAGENVIQASAIDVECQKMDNIKIELNTKAVEITGKGVLAEGPGGQKFYDADTVIYAVGQKALLKETDALRFCAPEFRQIGDCLLPTNIANAVSAAYYAARDLGRL